MQVLKDAKFSSLIATKTEIVPIVNPIFLAPTAGGFTYDPTTSALYYGNGTNWIQVGGGGAGTITSISQGVGITLSPNPIVGAGSVALANTAVTPGTYGNTSNVAQITVDQQGRITAATNVAITGGGGTLGFGAQAYKNVSQAIPQFAFTTVSYQATDFTLLATQPSFTFAAGVFTCTQAGTYLVNSCCQWQVGAGNFLMNLNKNGTVVIQQQTESISGLSPNNSITGVVNFGIGDTVFVSVAILSGIARNLTSGPLETGGPERGTQISFVRIF